MLTTMVIIYRNERFQGPMLAILYRKIFINDFGWRDGGTAGCRDEMDEGIDTGGRKEGKERLCGGLR